MIHFDQERLNQLDKTYRTQLLNSVYGFRPVNLIATIDGSCKENVAIFSSVVHLGANPSLIAFVQRPITAFSHTYKNILETGYFTINQVNKTIYKKAHYTSARFEKEVSEFEACQLTPEYKADFLAPFVQESPVQIALKFVQELPIELNNTKLIIGEVIHLFVNDDTIQNDGTIDSEKNQAVTVNGLESYYEAHKLDQFPYAKMKEVPNF